MDHRLIYAISDLEDAHRKVQEIAVQVQKTCTHAVVLETPAITSDFMPDIPAARICINCGLEESGRVALSEGGWIAENYIDEVILGNAEGRTILQTPNRDDFYLVRIPSL